MMIEDDELRDVFKTASEEHIQNLDEGFLYLEKNPQDQVKLEELLREAHSLKGDAGMLGIKDIATLAHQIEHILGAISRKELIFCPEISDRLSQGLDAIRKLVQEAITGELSQVNTFYVLANLMGASQPSKPEEVDEVETEPDVENKEVETVINVTSDPSNSEDIALLPVNLPLPTPVSRPSDAEEAEPHNPLPETDQTFNTLQTLTPLAHPTAHSAYKIETIRVATRNLDGLMTQTGELTVTKIRIAHRLNEIEEISALWEEWSRDAFVNRFVVHDLETRLGAGVHVNGAMGQLQSYHQRATERLDRLGVLVNRLRTSFSEDIARLDLITDELEEGIRTLRLLPLSTIFNLFPRMVRDLARQQGKQIELIISGGETRADKRILEEMKDPIMHILRNAIDHGVESPEEREQLGKPRTATLHLKGYQTATNIVIEVSDDGRGLDLEKIKQTALKRGIYQAEDLLTMTPNQIQSLIFSPGFTTRTFVTEVSGRGVGMDVVRTNVERLKGSIAVESKPKKGCTVRIQLGTTLATAHVLIIVVQGIFYAMPVECVQTTRLISPHDIFSIEGRQTVVFDEQPISVVRLADLLEIQPITFSNIHHASSSGAVGQVNSGSPFTTYNISTSSYQHPTVESSDQNLELLPCIILKVGEEQLGLFVDALVDEQDVVLKPQSRLLKRVRNIAGATILGTGEVCMVLNPQDLIKSVQKRVISAVTSGQTQAKPTPSKSVILLVEDSIATRTQEKRILEAAGYEVVTAVDGLDGFNKLKTRAFDAVVSDIQMPNLDGLGLTTKIRQQKEYSELPIILVTSLASDEDKRRGAEAGANAYITKGTFNQEVLLETLNRLV